jgi:hypothetical protein
MHLAIMAVDVSQSIMQINLFVGLNPGKAVGHALNFDVSGCSFQDNFPVFDLHGQSLRLGWLKTLNFIGIFY